MECSGLLVKYGQIDQWLYLEKSQPNRQGKQLLNAKLQLQIRHISERF
jgi:hypothetical protein